MYYGNDGTMFAAHLVNKSIKNLQFTAAYNNMKAAVAAGQPSAANTGGNREGYAVGLKYQVTPAIQAGTFYAHGRNNDANSTGVATNGISSGAGGFGLGYQATPSILLGANYVKTTFQAQMTNLQAHYMLSKRTRIYSQITLTQAAKGNAQTGTRAASGFSPIQCNSSTSSACWSALPGTAGFQNVPTNANGYSLGVIHTF